MACSNGATRKESCIIEFGRDGSILRPANIGLGLKLRSDDLPDVPGLKVVPNSGRLKRWNVSKQLSDGKLTIGLDSEDQIRVILIDISSPEFLCLAGQRVDEIAKLEQFFQSDGIEVLGEGLYKSEEGQVIVFRKGDAHVVFRAGKTGDITTVLILSRAYLREIVELRTRKE